MSHLDVFDGQCNLRTDARRRLQIGTFVVFNQGVDACLVVGDMGSLQYLLRSVESADCFVGHVTDGVVVVDLQLCVGNFRHDTQSINAFEVESRTYLTDKGLGILEILWVLIIGMHDISSVVDIAVAILVDVCLVQGDVNALVVTFCPVNVAQAVALSQVDHGVYIVLLNAHGVLADIAFLLRVEVGVVDDSFFHGLAQLHHSQLHGSQ